jgi:hypothetical protein
MAHFYGTLQGHRGEATRTGSKASGITTDTASWEGAVRVEVSHSATLGYDVARVWLIPWHGTGSSRLLYSGPVGG